MNKEAILLSRLLKQLISKESISQAQLATLANIDKRTISKYLNCRLEMTPNIIRLLFENSLKQEFSFENYNNLLNNQLDIYIDDFTFANYCHNVSEISKQLENVNFYSFSAVEYALLQCYYCLKTKSNDIDIWIDIIKNYFFDLLSDEELYFFECINLYYLIQSNKCNLALQFYEQHSNNNNNNALLPIIHQLVGVVYLNLYDPINALHHLEYADGGFISTNNYNRLIANKSNIANCYTLLQRYDLAKKYHLEVLKLAQRHNRYNVLNSTYNNLAFIEYITSHYLESITYANKVDINYANKDSLIWKAWSYIKIGDLDRAANIIAIIEKISNQKVFYKSVLEIIKSVINKEPIEIQIKKYQNLNNLLVIDQTYDLLIWSCNQIIELANIINDKDSIIEAQNLILKIFKIR